MTENLELDIEELRNACFTLAKALKWVKGPVDVLEIGKLGKDIESYAEHHALYLRGQDRDPNIVTRAIHYISHHYGEPFDIGGIGVERMLQVLIELACPNTQPVQSSNKFYDDIETGIREARISADENG